MKPEVKIFSKSNPCTKLEIWNCFRLGHVFRRVQVDVAHAVIGRNVPRVMERQGYLVKTSDRGSDVYALTAHGEAWLLSGFRSYLVNHPHTKVQYMPPPIGKIVTKKVIGRVRR